MPYDPDVHHRRSIRLRGYDYSAAAAYFVTVCTEGRECLFGAVVDGAMVANEIGRMIETFWHGLPKRYPGAELDEFVLMPNHVHGVIVLSDGTPGFVGQVSPPQADAAIASIGGVSSSHSSEPATRRGMLLPKIIGYFKMNTAKRANVMRGRSSVSLWQRNYYEHVIRDDVDLQRIRTYVAGNPAHWETDQLHPHHAPRW